MSIIQACTWILKPEFLWAGFYDREHQYNCSPKIVLYCANKIAYKCCIWTSGYHWFLKDCLKIYITALSCLLCLLIKYACCFVEAICNTLWSNLRHGPLIFCENCHKVSIKLQFVKPLAQWSKHHHLRVAIHTHRAPSQERVRERTT